MFTSESVSEGHPDKVCDRISDEVVDLFFREGPKAGIDPWQLRVACETLATTNQVVIAGETRGPKTITRDWIAHVARMAIKDIGYEQEGFHWEKPTSRSCCTRSRPTSPKASTAAGNKEEGAGDQGIMFGYACNETPGTDAGADLLQPQDPALISRGPARRQGGACSGPDSKSQVTVRYENGKPVGVTQIVVSHQHLVEIHDLGAGARAGRALRREGAARAAGSARTPIWHINPTGKFFIGGPDGDCGLTGRKIIVDTYGGAAPHGGGAFSGKDPTKVDRSAAYAARYLAKNVVAAGLADRCTIQLSYAIGVAKPLSIYVDLARQSQQDRRRQAREACWAS